MKLIDRSSRREEAPYFRANTLLLNTQSLTFPGGYPRAGVVQGSEGNLYETTSVQGSRGAGNVFRIIITGPALTLNSRP